MHGTGGQTHRDGVADLPPFDGGPGVGDQQVVVAGGEAARFQGHRHDLPEHRAIDRGHRAIDRCHRALLPVHRRDGDPQRGTASATPGTAATRGAIAGENGADVAPDTT